MYRGKRGCPELKLLQNWQYSMRPDCPEGLLLDMIDMNEYFVS